MSSLVESNLNLSQLKDIGLIYVREEPPGIKRRRCGRGFTYLDKNGAVIRDKVERQRLQSIAVPPTYNEVWYCPMPNGHLQATGFDSAAKKQYFYHKGWDQLRDVCKFNLMIAFAEKLPSMRRRVSQNLKVENLTKDAVLSAMIRILDLTGMRVGNAGATEKNETYGLTTLTKDHILAMEDEVILEYDGKGQVHQEKLINDPKVISIIEDCVEIPGQTLFQYERKGEYVSVDSADVNAFIKKYMGQSFTAKDFRTWRFSCLFLEEILENMAVEKKSLKMLLDNVSIKTGNTPSILKASYIHPGLISLVREQNWALLNCEASPVAGLRKAERILYDFIQQDYAQIPLQL